MGKKSNPEYQRRYRADHPDRAAEYSRKYRNSNKEKVKAKHKEWLNQKDNIEKVRACAREWNRAHPDVVKNRKTKWIIDNPEKIRKGNEKRKERAKIYYIKHRDDILSRNKIWSKNNHEKTRIKSSNRRALKRKNGGKITVKEWLWLKEFYNNTCLCCGKSEPEIKLTLDHVAPLALGGKNAIENAQPLCSSCNSKKATKYIDFRNKAMLL